MSLDLNPFLEKIKKDAFCSKIRKSIIEAFEEVKDTIENNNIQDLRDFQKKTDESLDTENKEIVGAINEVSSQCKDIAKKKFEYPKLNWEKETLNLNYKYGDIRRYGAKCDGVTDDSDVFQWALDNCSPNGISVYIPEDKITVIALSLIHI